jgi:hypothetical protein
MPRPLAHLANLALNLLVALRELVRERNVTRAAEQFGISQPRRRFPARTSAQPFRTAARFVRPHNS